MCITEKIIDLLIKVSVSFCCLLLLMLDHEAALGSSPELSLTPQEKVWLADHPLIRLGFNPHMEPLLIKAEDGSYDGIYPIILGELEKVLGISFSIEVDDWDPIVQRARKREIDGLLACAPSQAEASSLLRTRPILQSYPAVFTRHDASFIVNSLDDLKGKSIAYQQEVKTWTNIKVQPRVLKLTPEDQAWLDAHPIIRVGADSSWAPIEFLGSDGNYSGLAIDYLKKIEPMLGVRFEFVREDWQELIARAKQGQLDMFSCVAKTAEREKYLLFTEPYVEMPVGIFARDDVAYISNLSLIANEKIAVVEGYAIHDFLVGNYPDMNLVLVKTAEEGIRSLIRKRAFAFIDNTITAGHLIRHKGYLQIKLTGESLFANAQRMGVRKDWPQLRDILQKAIDTIPEAERNIIYNQWVPLTYEKPTDYSLIWKIGAGGFSFVVLILFWNRRLNSEVQKRTKDLLRSEEKYKAISEDMPVLICRFSPSGKILYVNDAYCKAFKKGRSECVGASFLASISEKDRDAVWNSITSLSSKAPTQTHEHRIMTTEADTRWQRWTKRALFNDQKQVVAYQAIGEDITERKQAERERENLKNRLGQAQKMEAIGTLAGGIAHDFNNILAAILGYTEMAKEDAPPGTRFAKDLDKVLIAAKRAKDLVRQILAFSRQSQVERIPIKIQPLIKEGLKMLRSSIPTTISITEDIDPESGVVLADPTQIHQILMNLSTNAYHAMEGTGGALSVGLKTTFFGPDEQENHLPVKPGEYVEFTVSDTGCGIGTDVIGKIFDPYFTTKETGRGTGMGLAIIHGIVSDYGGAITVESELGKGSSFHVYLPVVEEDALSNIIKPEDIPEGKERILFIDDEELLAEMGKDMLERLGYHVTVRHNSLEALTTFQNTPNRFDMVITDQTMPDMTGSDLARRMMQIRPDIPIILCTGYSNLIDEHSAKALGIKAFALKPLTKRVLAELIQKVLNEKTEA